MLAGITAVIASCAAGADDEPTSASQPPATDVAATTTPAASAPDSTLGSTAPGTTSIDATSDTTIETTTTTTGTTAPPAATSTAATPPCRRVTDFDGANDAWAIVNDGVMGGRSQGSVQFADSVMRFTGDVVTAGGGFTSLRLPLIDNELAETTEVTMRVRADDRIYGLTLQDDARSGNRSVSHRGDLAIDATADADGWVMVTLRYADLQPSIFGRAVDAPAFDPGTADEFGIIIADGVDGSFALEVDWIDACTR